MDSIFRNITLISFLHKGNFIYVYLPNKFWLSKIKKILKQDKYLNINDIGIMQKDYKKDLFIGFQEIENLKIYYLSHGGSCD